MPEPWTMEKRSRVSAKMLKEANRTAARLGATNVVVVAGITQLEVEAAKKIVGEFEDQFGDLTATECDWLARRIAAAAARPAQADGWQPIETLHRIDTDVVLWNPCDGVHLLSVMISLGQLDELRRSKVYTHWRRLEAPANERDIKEGSQT